MDSWSPCTALPAKCQAVYGWAGTIRAAKVLETISLSLVPQRVYGIREVFCTLTLGISSKCTDGVDRSVIHTDQIVLFSVVFSLRLNLKLNDKKVMTNVEYLNL